MGLPSMLDGRRATSTSYLGARREGTEACRGRRQIDSVPVACALQSRSAPAGVSHYEHAAGGAGVSATEARESASIVFVAEHEAATAEMDFPAA